MRTVAEIRRDIITATKNYKMLTTVLWELMPDVDTDTPGSNEMLKSVKEEIYLLLEEMGKAYNAEKVKRIN